MESDTTKEMVDGRKGERVSERFFIDVHICSHRNALSLVHSKNNTPPHLRQIANSLLIFIQFISCVFRLRPYRYLQIDGDADNTNRIYIGHTFYVPCIFFLLRAFFVSHSILFFLVR